MQSTPPTHPMIGFIGAGNMANSLIGGLRASDWPAERVCAADPGAEQRAHVQNVYGIESLADNAELVARADVVVLAVKPQVMQQVVSPLAAAFRAEQTVISIAAGIPLGLLRGWLRPSSPGLIRAMPNTPSLLGCGATGLVAGHGVADTGKQAASALFGAVGLVEWLETEAELDALMAVSGSGPAYVFAFMEAMAQAGQALGLRPAVAQRLAIATAAGAAAMAEQSGDSPAELRRKVTSPGGTTQAALAVMADRGLGDIVDAAMRANVARGQSMAAEFGANAPSDHDQEHSA